MIQTRVLQHKTVYRIQVLSGTIFRKWRFLGYNEKGAYETDQDKIRWFAEYKTLSSAILACEEYLLKRYPHVERELNSPKWDVVSNKMNIQHVIVRRST